MIHRAYLLCFLCPLLLVGCSTVKTAKGLYGETPEASASVSSEQLTRVVLSDFDLVDTKHAVQKALGLEGLSAEVVKSKMIAGVVDYEPNAWTKCYCSFAAYFQPTGKGKTEVVLLVDPAISTLFPQSLNPLMTTLVRSINTVLASYE